MISKSCIVTKKLCNKKNKLNSNCNKSRDNSNVDNLNIYLCFVFFPENFCHHSTRVIAESNELDLVINSQAENPLFNWMERVINGSSIPLALFFHLNQNVSAETLKILTWTFPKHTRFHAVLSLYLNRHTFKILWLDPFRDKALRGN